MAELADSPPSTSMQTRVRESMARYRELPPNKKMLLLGGIAAIFAVLVGSYFYMREPAYKVLFSNVSDRDGGQITEALQKLNVPYKLTDSGVIEIPSARVYDTRLKLAAQGLPKASGVGFELMDNQKFGISQFAEQVNYQRAVEGELARTVESMDVVEHARVHLAIPKQSVFVREQQPATASVMLTLRPGFILDAGQIAGIRNLVASAVPGLSQKNITIVDQDGNLISKHPDLDDGASGLSRRQLDYVRQVEQGLTKRIEAILEPIVGVGNVRAEVTAALDFSETEQTSENFNPNTPPNAAAIRSQQTSESTTRVTDPQGGVPGALSNQPPSAAAAPVTLPPGTQAGLMPAPANGQAQQPPLKSSKDNTTNYELDRTIQHVKQPMGSIKRVNAAVVVNYKLAAGKDGVERPTPLSEKEIKQIQDLVREAMGYNQQRGDSLNVVNASFAATGPEKLSLQDRAVDYLTSNLSDVLKYAVLGLVLMYLLFGVVRPVVRDIIRPKEAPLPQAGMEGVELDADGVPISSTDSGMPSDDPVEVARREYEVALEAARQVVRNDPRMAAQIIKEWVSNDE